MNRPAEPKFETLHTSAPRRSVPLERPAGLPFPAERIPGMNCHTLEDGGVTIEIAPRNKKLRALSWARAADAVIRRPPARPLLHDGLERENVILEALWPCWVRLTTNLTRRYPRRMENWTTDLLSEIPYRMAEVVNGKLLSRWKSDYPDDYRCLMRRIEDALKRHDLTPGFPNEPYDLTKDGLDTEFYAALLRVFAWRPDARADARPGLLESRWVHWPLVGEVELTVQLTHPPTPVDAPVPVPAVAPVPPTAGVLPVADLPTDGTAEARRVAQLT